MPLVNYCKKCKTEVPVGESCPYCGGKLTQTGEQISFGVVREPVKEWFAWNALLRIALPVLGLICVFVIAAEAAAAGRQGVIVMLRQGFAETMLWALGLTVVGIWGLLTLQGPEHVHVVLDKHGVWVRTYLPEGSRVGLTARLLSSDAAEKLEEEDDRPSLDGLMLVRRVFLPWTAVSRVRVWRENGVLLFFRPVFWQAAYVRCPLAELTDAEAFVRKKLKRQKKCRIIPSEKTKNG